MIHQMSCFLIMCSLPRSLEYYSLEILILLERLIELNFLLKYVLGLFDEVSPPPLSFHFYFHIVFFFILCVCVFSGVSKLSILVVYD